jgi:hypothetical protein
MMRRLVHAWCVLPLLAGGSAGGVMCDSATCTAADASWKLKSKPPSTIAKAADDEAIRFGVIPWRGQVMANVLVSARSSENFRAVTCLADRIYFDEQSGVVTCTGKAFVDAKGVKPLYQGDRLFVDGRKGTITAGARGTESVRNEQKPPNPAAPSSPTDVIWSDYKVEFLVRMTPGLQVVTLADDWPSLLSSSRVQEARVIVGEEPAVRHGDVLFLRPDTDAKKVILANFLGHESRNWIPYDEKLEERIIALAKTLNVRIQSPRQEKAP